MASRVEYALLYLDPFNNRIFYQRVDELLILNTEGQILNSIGYPANTISPWANVQYHDLSTLQRWSARIPKAAPSRGTAPPQLTLSHNLGSADDVGRME